MSSGRQRHGPRARGAEAIQFVKAIDFPPAGRAFDSAFDKERDS